MSVRKTFCEVTDFNGDTLALTEPEARMVVRIYERSDLTRWATLRRNFRVYLEERTGVVVKKYAAGALMRWWVVSPRDVASIKRLLAKDGAL